MDLLFIYLLITVLIICGLVAFYMVIYNKFQESIIRINEAEANIDTLLRSKYDDLNKAMAIIKGNVKIEKEIFEDIIKLRSRKISNFELDRQLVLATNEFTSLKTEYKELEKSEEIKKISVSLKEIDDKLDNLKKYYDKNITKYNKLVRTFPNNIVALICKYEEKLFYDKKDMSDDDYNDFKLWNHFFILQSISLIPFAFKKLFVFENGLLPKKPFEAENGDGCVDSIIKCLGLVIKFFLPRAKEPHKRKTTGVSFSFTFLIMASVNSSQPLFLCEAGLSLVTVKTAFKSRTPCFAHGSKFPVLAISQPKSLYNSL